MKKNSLQRRAAGAAAVTAALLVPLGVFGAPAFAKHSPSPSSAQYQYKITICHHTHSWKHPWHQIRVSQQAWKAHARHGDTMGACTTEQLAVVTTHVKTHGHSDENHGKSDH